MLVGGIGHFLGTSASFSSPFSAPTVHLRLVGIAGQLELDQPGPTPEPATLLLVGTGAAGIGLARWWKRRRSHAS